MKKMIKFDDVLEAASKVLSQSELKTLTAMESRKDPRQTQFVVKVVIIAERAALDSVYNGDCDMAVFSHYKLVRDFGNLYRDYNDERYAKGS